MGRIGTSQCLFAWDLRFFPSTDLEHEVPYRPRTPTTSTSTASFLVRHIPRWYDGERGSSHRRQIRSERRAATGPRISCLQCPSHGSLPLAATDRNCPVRCHRTAQWSDPRDSGLRRCQLLPTRLVNCAGARAHDPPAVSTLKYLVGMHQLHDRIPHDAAATLVFRVHTPPRAVVIRAFVS